MIKNLLHICYNSTFDKLEIAVKVNSQNLLFYVYIYMDGISQLPVCKNYDIVFVNLA